VNISRQLQIHQQQKIDEPDPQHQTFLMCPPDHFRVMYEINPWMDLAVQPDLDLAREQWNTLVSHLKLAGATVEIMPSVASLPDMVFTADIGIIHQQCFIMSHFRYRERQPEAFYGACWFRRHNYEVVEPVLATGASLESSDLRPFSGYLLAGYGFRSSLSAHKALAHLLQCRLLSIEFVDPRLYHLDTSFCPLDERRAIIAPAAWSRRSCELIKQLVPEPLILELDEALTFCANSVVVGRTVIMPCCPVRVGRVLERWGFTVCLSPTSEFLKAGGAVHCLALALSVPLSSSGDEILSRREKV
jgi:N-dimethylarginine dimethylaminohydrolase